MTFEQSFLGCNAKNVVFSVVWGFFVVVVEAMGLPQIVCATS